MCKEWPSGVANLAPFSNTCAKYDLPSGHPDCELGSVLEHVCKVWPSGVANLAPFSHTCAKYDLPSGPSGPKLVFSELLKHNKYK